MMTFVKYTINKSTSPGD